MSDVGGLVAWLRAQLDDDEAAWRMVDARDVVQTLHGRPIAPQMLADVAAKRRILDEHHPVDPCDAHDAMMRSEPCQTVRLLALPYADRPGFRDEWRLS